MLLTTYRPGYRPPWLDKSYATQLALRSLAPTEALTVVRSTRSGAALPAHLEQTIVEKAEGNPFFLEELTRAILEQGALQTAGSVPDTIQGVLSARIDRLPEDHKRLVQTAAVLGREFSRSLLEAIWDGGAVDPLLVELQRLEFLYERTGAEEPTYVFKHALTQEVAYESLLTTRRQALHAAAGQALERRYADRLDEVADRLAYHYARTDNAAKAVEYLSAHGRASRPGFCPSGSPHGSGGGAGACRAPAERGARPARGRAVDTPARIPLLGGASPGSHCAPPGTPGPRGVARGSRPG